MSLFYRYSSYPLSSLPIPCLFLLNTISTSSSSLSVPPQTISTSLSSLPCFIPLISPLHIFTLTALYSFTHHSPSAFYPPPYPIPWHPVSTYSSSMLPTPWLTTPHHESILPPLKLGSWGCLGVADDGYILALGSVHLCLQGLLAEGRGQFCGGGGRWFRYAGDSWYTCLYHAQPLIRWTKWGINLLLKKNCCLVLRGQTLLFFTQNTLHYIIPLNYVMQWLFHLPCPSIWLHWQKQLNKQ